MRDPKRINNLLTTIKKIWKRDPDLRFGQLMENFKKFVEVRYNKEDLFYIEDELLEEYFIAFEKEWYSGPDA